MRVPFNLVPSPEISAFGLARLKRTRLLSVSNGSYKFDKYIERSFSTLKTPFR